MPSFAKQTTTTLIPSLRYRDALAMIAWLETAFGFTRQAVYMGDGDLVAHAQLTFGNGMLMLGSAANHSEASSFMRQPDEIGNAETQTVYLVVDDCDAIYASAKAAGAEMLLDLSTKDYGGKGFTCRDPEGHIWSVGSYDPWQ